MKSRTILPAALVFGLACSLSVSGEERPVVPPPDAFGVSGQPIVNMKTIDQVEPRLPIYQLPYTITQEGSYYLVSSMGNISNSHGIIIASGNVHVDLNGFGIFGTSNSLNAIIITTNQFGGDAGNITICNGVIGEWGGYAVYGTNAHDCEVTRLKIFENQTGGIRLGSRAKVTECSVDGCNGAGIEVSEGSVISDCKVFQNRTAGIKVALGGRVNACMAVENAGDGISVDNFSTVKECQVGMNHTNGITVASSCLILNNNCAMNGATNNAGAGINVTGRGNRIENNNLNMNYRGILLLDGRNRVENNTVVDNTWGIWDQVPGNLVTRNAVGGSNTNFYMSSTSNYGMIVTNPGPNFVSDNPWANFELTQ